MTGPIRRALTSVREHDRLSLLLVVGACTYAISYDALVAFFSAGGTPWPLYYLSPIPIDLLMLAALWYTRGLGGARAAYAWFVVILFTLVSWFANAAHPYTLGHHLDDRPSLWDYMSAHPISTAQAGLPSLALALVAHLFLITRLPAPQADVSDPRAKRSRARRSKGRARTPSGPRPFIPVPAVREQGRAA